MDGLIPMRGGKAREMLDSAFLLKYARRLERQAKGIAFGYAAVGSVVGYGIAVAYEAVKALVGGLMHLPGLMLLLPPEVKTQALMDFPWATVILPVAVGAWWGFKGLNRADDMRFKAQMALHMLKLHEMARDA